MKIRSIVCTLGEQVSTYDGRRSALSSPHLIARAVAPIIRDQTVEVFGAMLLDTRNRPLGWHEASRGTLNASMVHPREVFRPAIHLGACSIVIAHNHPSGDPNPSAQDDSVTRRIIEAGKIIGIPCIDHVIIGEGERYYSYRMMSPALDWEK